MEKLEEHFKTRVEITQKCLEFVKGDPEETMSETNSAMIELGELKHKMEVWNGYDINCHNNIS